MARTEREAHTSPYDIRLARDSVREAIDFGVPREVLDNLAREQRNPEIRDAMFSELKKLSNGRAPSQNGR